jgi:hypothetical protein
MHVRTLVLTALLSLALASGALAVGKGTTMLALQVTHGTADLYDPSGVSGGYISAFDHSEVGVQALYWNMMTDDYAFTVSAGFGTFSEVDKPGGNAPASSPDHKYSQNSFSVRVGGDRVMNVGNRGVLFFGPGLEYWDGTARFVDIPGVGAGTVETNDVRRYSLSGRMGGHMMVGETWGLTTQVGYKIGYASAEDTGAKATWWPSSIDASGGVVFMFGSS